MSFTSSRRDILSESVLRTVTFAIDHFQVSPGQGVDLSLIDANDTPFWDPTDKAGAKKHVASLAKELQQQQAMLWAQGKHKVLLVLQAMDAGGKDGTIGKVLKGMNPSGVRVESFKKPTNNELAHDYLWRVHQKTPGAGELTVFNRSHYEDVLVVRVMDLVEPRVWQKRYDHIKAFEQLLSDEGTTVIKIYLHISKDEQRNRLQSRLDEPTKNWKFDVGDLEHRTKWDQYQEAFQDALNKTSTADCPWYVVPANRKWYRNIVVSEILNQTLTGLKLSYPKAPDIANIVIDS